MQRAQLFIGRLPRETRRSDLEDIFKRYGRVTRCDVRMGLATAYAFIDFDDHRDAEDALKYENGRDMRGQRMVVEWAIDDAKYGRSGGRRNNGGRGGGDRGDRGGRGNYRRSRSRSPRSKSRSASPNARRGGGADRDKRRRSPSRSRSRSQSYENKKSERSSREERSRSRSRSNSK